MTDVGLIPDKTEYVVAIQQVHRGQNPCKSDLFNAAVLKTWKNSVDQPRRKSM